MRPTLCAALLAAACLVRPTSGEAQQPTQRQLDSLAAELRALRARLDSLHAELRRLAPRPVRDSAQAGDEIAALRAAAQALAGRDTVAPADSAPSTQPVAGRERNLSLLNPEITVTGDLRGAVQTEGAQRDNFELGELEFSFQSALDPYSHTRVFVALHEGEVDVEEGYFYYTGLPARLRLDLGIFRQPFGELNRWHPHALPEPDYPLALTTYLGDEGLAGTGASLYRAFGGLGTHEVTVQITRSESDAVLFGGGGRLSYLARLLNFWQLGRSTYLQLGGSVLYGTNPDSSLRTTVGGIDVRLTWRPPARALYRDWTLRGELFALRKRAAGVGPTRLGGYVGTTYRLDRRWVAGVRFDYVEAPPPAAGEITRQVTPSLTLWQSEWVYLRALYRWQQTAGADATHHVGLQAVWAIGPHKHETY